MHNGTKTMYHPLSDRPTTEPYSLDFMLSFMPKKPEFAFLSDWKYGMMVQYLWSGEIGLRFAFRPINIRSELKELENFRAGYYYEQFVFVMQTNKHPRGYVVLAHLVRGQEVS